MYHQIFILSIKEVHNYVIWLHPMTKWPVMKLVNTAMLTQTSCVILVYNMTVLTQRNNNIANLCMLYLSIQALHSVTTLTETSHSILA